MLQVAGIRRVQVLTDLGESTPRLVNNESAVEKINWAIIELNSEIWILLVLPVMCLCKGIPSFPAWGLLWLETGEAMTPFKRTSR